MEALEQIKQKKQFRTRPVRTSKIGRYVSINGRQLLNFNSNDYLAISHHPKLVLAAADAAQKFGYGSGGSPFLAGYSSLHQELEYAMADFLGYPSCVLFSSGYLLNLGIPQALLSKGDCLLEDKLNHASLLDAAKLSPAQLKRYPHLQLNKAQQILIRQNAKQNLWVSDGVFSMDGDVVDLRQMLTIAQSHKTLLWIDDAHGIGSLGEKGQGCIEQQQLESRQIDLLSGTFGKAFGTTGAFICGNRDLIELIVQQARTYKFNTALPIPDVAATLAALQIIKSEPWRREKILELSDYFRQQAQRHGLSEQLNNKANFFIQPVMLGDEQTALQQAQHLINSGIFTSAIRPPTVPSNQCRLRITITAHLEKEDIDLLIQCLLGNY